MLRSILRTRIALRNAQSKPIQAFPAVGAPTRGFATEKKAAPAAKVVTASAVSSPARSDAPALKTVKKELAAALSDDVSDLTTAPDQGLAEYIREQRMKITPDPTCDEVVIKRSVGEYELTIRFDSNIDEEAQPEQNEHDEEGEHDEEADEDQDTEEGEQDEAMRMPTHSFTIDIYNTARAGDAKNNFMHIAAYTDAEGELCVESLIFDENLAPLNTPNTEANTDPIEEMMETGFKQRASESAKLYFDDLSDQSQDKLLAFLQELGVDDRLAQFIQHYAQIVRTQGFLKKLQQFKGFLG